MDLIPQGLHLMIIWLGVYRPYALFDEYPPPFSAGGFSDSEGEFDNEDAHVTLPQRMHGVGNTKSQVCVNATIVHDVLCISLGLFILGAHYLRQE